MAPRCPPHSECTLQAGPGLIRRAGTQERMSEDSKGENFSCWPGLRTVGSLLLSDPGGQPASGPQPHSHKELTAADKQAAGEGIPRPT